MAVSHQEVRHILAAIEAEGAELNEMALATVVEVEGSAYRRTGARMLIRQNGRWTGTISGGCLEGDALRRAREVVRAGVPQRVTYDTRTDESAKQLGASLGCNGLIEVWIEPLMGFGALDLLQRLKDAAFADAGLWYARFLEGEKMGQFVELAENAENPFGIMAVDGLQSVRIGDEMIAVAVEQVLPALHLFIFGGGDDARPLCQLASQMGWRVTVTDDCKAKALPVRFPEAEQVIQLDRLIAAQTLQPNAYSAAVLLSHNYAYDQAILSGLLPFDLPYIGILGPKKRFERMNDAFEGRLSSMDAIHAPIGLDIGGQTPFEIALAIVAEIQAKWHQRAGGFLKLREGAIHTRKLAQV